MDNNKGFNTFLPILVILTAWLSGITFWVYTMNKTKNAVPAVVMGSASAKPARTLLGNQGATTSAVLPQTASGEVKNINNDSLVFSARYLGGVKVENFYIKTAQITKDTVFKKAIGGKLTKDKVTFSDIKVGDMVFVRTTEDTRNDEFVADVITLFK